MSSSCLLYAKTYVTFGMWFQFSLSHEYFGKYLYISVYFFKVVSEIDMWRGGEREREGREGGGGEGREMSSCICTKVP